MSFTSNKETKKKNIRKIKYSTTEIKYTRWEKRLNYSKKNIENYARLNFKRCTYQNINLSFFLSE